MAKLSAAALALLAPLALCVAGADQPGVPDASASCADVPDTTSLLSVAVELHHVAKAAEAAPAAAAAGTSKQDPATSLASALQATMDDALRAAQNFSQGMLDYSSRIEERYGQAEQTTQGIAAVLEEFVPTMSADLYNQTVAIYGFFNNTRDSIISALTEPSDQLAVEQALVPCAVVGLAMDQVILSLAQGAEGWGSLPSVQIADRAGAIGPGIGAVETDLPLYVNCLQNAVSGMLDVAANGLAAPDGNVTELRAQFDGVLNTTRLVCRGMVVGVDSGYLGALLSGVHTIAAYEGPIAAGLAGPTPDRSMIGDRNLWLTAAILIGMIVAVFCFTRYCL